MPIESVNDIDRENLEISFPVASSEPFPRIGENGPYLERLAISESAIDLTRLNGGASVLKNHDTEHILGTVLRAWIQDSRLWVRARFCRNTPEAVQTFADIADGTNRNVSLGYQQDKLEYHRENGATYGDVTRWTVYEVSVAVGVPADPTVGFYRSFNTNAKKQGEIRMAEELKSTATVAHAVTRACGEPAPEEETKKKAKKAAPEGDPEEEDTSDTCEGDGECKKKACKRDFDETCMKTLIDTRIRSLNAISAPAIVQKERSYSFCDALRYLLTGQGGEYEREVSSDLYKRSGLTMSGNDRFPSMMIPLDRRDFGVAASNASGLVATENRPDMFIDYIRTKVAALGAQVITGLKGPVTIPAQTGTGTVGWVATLNTDAAAAEPAIGSISMSPKKLAAFTKIQKDVIIEGIPDPVNLALRDLLELISRKLNYTLLKGNAADPAITGVDTAAGVQTVVIADLSASTWQKFLEFGAKIGDLSVSGTPRFVMKSAAMQTLKGVSKDAGSGRYICENGQIDGYSVVIDGSIGDNDLFFGDFSNVLVGQWGGLEVMLDPYTFIRSGAVQIVANLVADVAVRNPATFVKRVTA